MKKIIIVLAGVFTFLFVLEISLRLEGLIPGWRQTSENFRATQQTNTYRILCLGASTTQGQYPQLLEKELNQRHGRMRFSVIDKGETSMNSRVALEKLPGFLAQYHPHMIVAMLGSNDRSLPREAVPAIWSWFFEHCRTFKFAQILWMDIAKRFFAPDSQAKRSLPTAIRSSSQQQERSAKPFNIFLALGGICKERGDYARSEDSLQNALRFAPKDIRAANALGEVYLKQGKYLQAERIFRRAIAIDPRSSDAYTGLGWVFLGQEQYSRAEDFLKKAASLDPENGRPHLVLGKLYQQRGEWSQAEDAFLTTLQLDPKNDYAYFALGWIYRLQGKLPEAEMLFAKALRINPKIRDRAIGALMSLYEEQGQTELAREYAGKAERLYSASYETMSAVNYRAIKKILDRKKITLVCVQYPMRSIQPLRATFKDGRNIVWVDNEKTFKEAVKRGGYHTYFRDMFAGDFGHCTKQGNELLAKNIADAILEKLS